LGWRTPVFPNQNTKIEVGSFYLAAMIDICPQPKIYKKESQNETIAISF
jgi:hypothetical protein